MSAKATKKSTKVNKQRRRRTLTFARMIKYGLSNFSRNIWLTVAATAVMAVTLLIILMTFVARDVLIETIADVSKSVDMPVHISGDAPEDDILTLKSQIEKLDNVREVRYVSASEARAEQANRYKNDPAMLEAIKEVSGSLPASLRIVLYDINDIAPLDNFFTDNDLFEKIRDPSIELSFKSERRQAISSIAQWVKLAEIGGGVMTIVFVVISSLVVFNTIRMAIFNRKDEIQMMKLIGAERSFIRGPFLVEAVMYGLIAALVATAVGYALVYLARDPLAGYELPIDSTLDTMTGYLWLIVIVMIVIGTAIGVISSYIATRKYLKI